MSNTTAMAALSLAVVAAIAAAFSAISIRVFTHSVTTASMTISVSRVTDLFC